MNRVSLGWSGSGLLGLFIKVFFCKQLGKDLRVKIKVRKRLEQMFFLGGNDEVAKDFCVFLSSLCVVEKISKV